ncbi:17814_t:CDS:2 [Funneliformis geosporum]|nr:17814_t:CDS:2 [Funneliformis geosporum]
MTSNRPFINFAFINNGRILSIRSQRSINQRRRNRCRRQRNANYQFINNEDTINRITSLPTQVVNDEYINGKFQFINDE